MILFSSLKYFSFYSPLFRPSIHQTNATFELFFFPLYLLSLHRTRHYMYRLYCPSFFFLFIYLYYLVQFPKSN